MAFRQKFQHQPTALASFDFEDIAEGTGIETFYGFSTETNAGVAYGLTSDSTLYSSQVDISGSISAGAIPQTGTLDLDFDLSPFNTPRILKGIANINIAPFVGGAAGQDMSGSAIVHIRKVGTDGTTETEIVSANGQLFNVVPSGTTGGEMMTIPLTIPRTPFKIGESLRVTVQPSGTKYGGSNEAALLGIGHDPRNRSGSYLNPSADFPSTINQVICKIPFELDL